MVSSQTIAKVSSASAIAVRGQNHRARLVISPEEAGHNSPFLLMAEDWFSPPAGFPTHPHRGMETVTYVRDGDLIHEDHTGGRGALSAGGVAFMTAGAGVLHSEMPGPQGVHSLQLWLNLPAKLKFMPARYSDLEAAAAPVYREHGVLARVCAGKLGDIRMPHGSTWPLTLIDFQLEVGREIDVPLPAGERSFVFLLAGEAALGAEGRLVKEGDVAWPGLSPAGAMSTLHVVARSAVQLLFYSSPIIDEPIVMGGPFVMNTDLEVQQAFADLRGGRLTTPSLRVEP